METTENVKASSQVKVNENELILKEKILNYINQHEDGIRVYDMEIPLCETRMTIGYVSKKLLEEGQVRKVENLYYPLPRKNQRI